MRPFHFGIPTPRISIAIELNKSFKGVSEISMGMSNDFELAIKNGSTMIRIGTGIFGERN